MVTSQPRGFHRSELTARYGSPIAEEDAWHTYSGAQAIKIIAQILRLVEAGSPWLLNAGAGIYDVASERWREVSLDLFAAPIEGRAFPVCGSVEGLPFRD